jgi:hypothetical protein
VADRRDRLARLDEVADEGDGNRLRWDALDVDRGDAGRSSIGRWAETLRYR